MHKNGIVSFQIVLSKQPLALRARSRAQAPSQTRASRSPHNRYAVVPTRGARDDLYRSRFALALGRYAASPLRPIFLVYPSFILRSTTTTPRCSRLQTYKYFNNKQQLTLRARLVPQAASSRLQICKNLTVLRLGVLECWSVLCNSFLSI